MTEEEFVLWIFMAPDDEVRQHGTVIRPGRVVRFKFEDSSYILGLNSKKEVAINGEFWDLGPDVAGVMDLMALFR